MENINYKLKNNLPINLEDLKEHKQKVLKDIRTQHDMLSGRFDKAVSPFTRKEGTSPLMNSFNIGMATIDTLIIGIRIFKKIGHIFNRKKREY